ncbi:hypothetical protein EAF04_005873 [Stromatinia cepivora]|nr:hypothetical protein EAF04_005873 [Stromatinia cepivora]
MTTEPQRRVIELPLPPVKIYGDLRSVLHPVPLPLGCALENRPLTTESKESKVLFKSPFGFLQAILNSLGPKDLANFALVNRECRQLARSRQFTAVHIDLNSRSWDIVQILCYERLERAKSDNGVVSFRTLGACIRSITVKVQDKFTGRPIQNPSLEHRLDSPRGQHASGEGYNERAIYNLHFELRKILCCRWTLPHLETLKWNLDYCFDKKFLMALARPSLRHLILFDIKVDEFPASLYPLALPLRTLFLKARQTDIEGRTDRFCLALLQRCAPTIECLVWHGDVTIDRSIHLHTKLPFPRLYNLYLRQANPNCFILTSLLKSKKLRNLRIDFFRPMNDSLRNFINTYGRIETLETFSFATPPLAFLRANNQLSNINFDSTRAGSGSFEDSVVVLEILIISRFNNLTSLGIHFSKNKEDFPGTALKLIGRLTGLNQLLISNNGALFAPATDHKVILTSLRPLEKLKKLVIEGDIYESDTCHCRPDEYYTATNAIDGDTFDPNMSEEEIQKAKSDPEAGKPYWKIRHDAKMKSIGLGYEKGFRQLEILYMGRRLFYFSRKPGNPMRGIASPPQSVIDFYTGEMFHMVPWDRLSDKWTSRL